TFCLLEVESYLNENARITAYGILSMLLEHCPRLITEMTVDIVGFGHCGKEIVHLLEQLEVSVRIITKGICDTNFECLLYEDWKYVEPSDVIINTAPAVVINEYDCGRWKKDPIIIDLSTGHIGVAEVVRNCIQVIDAPALPDIIGCQSAAFCYYQHLIRWLT
ncbi:MAG: hypothetical protein PUF50_05550, partial [Erysipelotrichaceae bacterium]|nr:hypothetical protein [Erysipelotrichaceae bacterium]